MSLGVTRWYERIARKKHICVDCEQGIEPGTAYVEQRTAYTENGKFGNFSVKIHRTCHDRLEKENEEYQREMAQTISNEHMWEHKYP
ncbi:hypothetical protein B1748_23660 [Paenibacillus sp. MY03]|uniref:hypothetical protein n=1 Tax=Paenibacillus sp. MY03 TaxID=302980 RepID=UPI000B3C0F6E|nr:hypothetical protein [Paenibacillus sp. MY03]OUS73007.1 hypothetical protein B1748_23660 [Paenibacillus sp. MY03]